MLEKISHEFLIFLFSMLPFFELRLSIPYGILNQIPWQETFILSVLGNFIPIIPLLFLLEKFFLFLRKYKIFDRLYCSLMRNIHKNSALVLKYGKIGLYFFVSIPIPGSGIYTGSALALLFGISRKDAFLPLTFGMFTAGVLTMLATLGIVNIFEEPLFIFIAIIFVFLIYKKISK